MRRCCFQWLQLDTCPCHLFHVQPVIALADAGCCGLHVFFDLRLLWIHFRLLTLDSAMSEAVEEEEIAPAGVSLDGLWRRLSDNEIIREKILRHGSLFAWPSKDRTGIINFTSLAQNSLVVRLVLDIWCPQLAEPKSLYVAQVRDQVRVQIRIVLLWVPPYILVGSLFICSIPLQVAQMRSHLSLPQDDVRASCDATLLRGFVTYIIRRHDGSVRRVSWITNNVHKL